jgi:hypothetical protein
MRLLVEGSPGCGAGEGIGRCRTRARSPGPEPGSDLGRCGSCSSRSSGRWRPRRHRGAWYRGLRLVALDGTTLDVPNTQANAAAFGRPGGGRGQGAFPQVRLVGLVECGTHAVVDAARAGCTWARARWHRRWLARLIGGCCCWSTRGCAVWSCADPAGHRGAAGVALPPGCDVAGAGGLPDGSWRSELGQSQPKHKRVAVRVIDYRRDDPGRLGEPEGYRLITTMLDPRWRPRRNCRRCTRSGGSWRRAG